MKTNNEKEELVEQTNLNTMVDCVNSLVRKGFTEDFKAKKDGLLSLATEKLYQPDEIKILNFYRFEGQSDPADNSILYAIETADGKKGTLVDAFGPYADHNVTNFMHHVEEISKKTDRSQSL
jgi:hypothetical protein